MKQNKLFQLIVAFIVTYIATTNHCNAQIIQNGVVKEYREASPKVDLGGVEIFVNKASSTVSQDDGKFSLSFQTLKPGDKVLVRKIEKLGYEVFNKEALEQWYISKDNHPFVIVMCKSERFKKIRESYEKVSSESYAKQYKKEEIDLLNLYKNNKISKSEYDSKVEELANNFDNQLEHLDKYIDRVARIDLSELTTEEQQIILQMQQGNVNEAIHLYDKMELEEKLHNSSEEIKKIEASISVLDEVKMQRQEELEEAYAMICRKNDLLYLAGGAENLQKIKDSKRSVAMSDTTFVKAVRDYGYFLQEIGDYEESTRMLHIALNHNESREDNLYIRLGLSVNAAKIGEYELAGNIAIEITDIAIEEYKDDNIFQMMFLKEVIQWIGELFTLQGYMKEAEEQFKNYREILNLLNEIVPPLDGKALIEKEKFIQNTEQLAHVNLYQGNFNKAEEYILSFLKDGEQLYAENPDKNGRNLASYYFILASCKYQTSHVETSQLVVAEEYINKAISIMEKLCFKYADLYSGELADYQYLLAGIIRTKGDKNVAITWYGKARENFRKNLSSLLNKNGIFSCNIGIASSLVEMEKYSEAKGILMDALSFYYQELSHSSITDGTYVAGLIFLIECYHKLEDYSSSALYENEAMKKIEESYPQYPSRYANLYAQIHYKMGCRLMMTGHLDDAETYLMKAIRIIQKKEVPYYDEVEKMYYSLAYIYTQKKKFSLAEKMIDKALRIAPNELLFLDVKGELLMMRGKDKQACQIWRKLQTENPNWADKNSNFCKMMKEK